MFAGLMLGWFPIFSAGEDFVDSLWHLALPAIALATGISCNDHSNNSAAVVAELSQDYVTRSRVCLPRRITRMYLRAASLPILSPQLV